MMAGVFPFLPHANFLVESAFHASLDDTSERNAPAAPDSPAGAPGDAPVGDQQDDVPYQPSPTKDNLDEDTQGALDLMADFGALLDL